MAHFFKVADVCYLWWPQGMQLELGKFFFQVAEEVGVKCESQIGMMTALQ